MPELTGLSEEKQKITGFIEWYKLDFKRLFAEWGSFFKEMFIPPLQ